MKDCVVCENESEELFQCNSCHSLYCEGCGTELSNYCNDCNEFLDSDTGLNKVDA